MWRVLRAVAVAFAMAGGAVLLLVAIVTLVSVGGRWLLSQPVAGDVELAQLGTATALALFLPYCQLHGSHLIVDIFTARAGSSVHRRLDLAAHAIAALVLALLALRAGAGILDLRRAGETSMVLGLPLWLAYAAMAPSLALAALIALLGWQRDEVDDR